MSNGMKPANGAGNSVSKFVSIAEQLSNLYAEDLIATGITQGRDHTSDSAAQRPEGVSDGAQVGSRGFDPGSVESTIADGSPTSSTHSSSDGATQGLRPIQL